MATSGEIDFFERGFGGRYVREPAGQRGYSAKKIFGGFRISLTAKPSRRTPRAESIRGRLSASSFGYAFRGLKPTAIKIEPLRGSSGSVIPFASRTPLPPSISLRTLRSLRLKILWRTSSATRKRFRLRLCFLAGRWTRRRQAAALPGASVTHN